MDFDTSVRLAVYDHFVERCEAPTGFDIAHALGARPPDVHESFIRLAELHVLTFLPNTNYLWMANPFSAVPTAFKVTSDEKRWWGNCIWDALGILAAVERDGNVSTWCPDCAEPLEVRVRGGEVERGDGVVHFVVPASRWWDDIGFT